MQKQDISQDTEGSLKTQRRLKIALLGYRSHPFVGGQGIYIKYLSRALTQLGHEVHVYSGQPYPDLDSDVPLFKVPSLDLYEEDNHLAALRLKHFRSFADVYEWWTMATGGFGEPYTFGRRVTKLLRQEQYDIVHDNQSLCYGLLKLQKNGHKVISTLHHPIHKDRELALANESRWGHRLLIKRWHSFLTMQEKVVRKLDYICTVSQQSQRDIETHFKRNAEDTPVVFNGVDTDIFKPLAHIKAEPFQLITTSSSDHPLKGLKYLLASIKALVQDYPNIKLTIIGELEKDGECARYIRSEDLDNHVTSRSGITTETLVKLYNQSTAVICPSLYEGFGLPAAEALACGRPLISAQAGALPEVVGDAGILVEPANSFAISEAIKNIFENDVLQKKLSLQARTRAEEHFCWRKVAQQFEKLYFQMMDNN